MANWPNELHVDSPSVAQKLNYCLGLFSVSVNVFFGFLQLINVLGIKYFYLYSPQIINATVFSTSVDFWIWLVSLVFVFVEIFGLHYLHVSDFPRWTFGLFLPAVASVLVFLVDSEVGVLVAVASGVIATGSLLYHGFPFVSKRKTLVFLGLFSVSEFLIFETLSLLTWVWNLFSYDIPFRSFGNWRFALLDLQFFNVFYAFTQWLFIAFLFGWAWIPVGKYILLKISVFKTFFAKPWISGSVTSFVLSRRTVLIGLVFVVATAAFVSYYPYVHVSPGTLVGVDSVPYYKWLEKMSTTGPMYAFSTDRPITLLLMYGLQHSVGLASEVAVRIMPGLCAIGLSLVVFWFVLEGTKNRLLALTSALFSVLSFQTVAGVFINSIANWLAVIEVLVLFALLLRSFRKRVWVYTIASSIVGMVLLLTHSVTWYFVMIVVGVYFLWKVFSVFVKRQVGERSACLRLAVILCLNLVFFVGYSFMPFGGYVTGSWMSALSSGGISLNNVSQGFGLSIFTNVLLGLQNVVQVWIGGVFANPLLLALSIAGLFAVRTYEKNFRSILLFWIAILSLSLFVGSPNSYFYYRVVYLLPFQIFAAFGFFWIFERIGSAAKISANRSFQVLVLAAFVLVVLFLFNYSLRSVDSSPFYSLP